MHLKRVSEKHGEHPLVAFVPNLYPVTKIDHAAHDFLRHKVARAQDRLLACRIESVKLPSLLVLGLDVVVDVEIVTRHALLPDGGHARGAHPTPGKASSRFECSGV
jgi:hypothetical protein